MNEVERALREDAEAERASWRRHMRQPAEPALTDAPAAAPGEAPPGPAGVLDPIARAVVALAARCGVRRDESSR